MGTLPRAIQQDPSGDGMHAITTRIHPHERATYFEEELRDVLDEQNGLLWGIKRRGLENL